MPIYEYQCRNCGAEFEEWQKITDPVVQSCRSCGGEASRLISQSSFVLKGTGWYVTDYARKDSASPPKTESKSNSDSTTASASSSTESSKPATGATTSGTGE